MSASIYRHGWMYRLLSKKLLPALFIIGIGLEPVYFLPSGLPQISDWVLITWAGLTILTFPSTAMRAIRYAPMQIAGILVLYIALVNITWAIYLSNGRVAFYSLFYIYNFAIVWALVCSVLTDPIGWRKRIISGLVIATAMMLAMLVVRFDASQVRQTAGFNNPNQLGYYALLVFCITLLLFNVWRSGRFWYLVGVTNLMLPFSASLGATAGFSVAYLRVLLTIRLRRLVRFLAIAFIVFVVMWGILFYSGWYEHLAWQVQSRLNVADRKMGRFVDERGYSRIWEYPEYTVLGAGEGAIERFGPHHRHELHSTLGTLLFSYGIPGISLFLLLLWYIGRRKIPSIWFLMIAPLVYSLTHQGLRTTMFWVFLFLVWLYGEERKRSSPSGGRPVLARRGLGADRGHAGNPSTPAIAHAGRTCTQSSG